MRKKGIAILLAAALCIGMLPSAAMAEEVVTTETENVSAESTEETGEYFEADVAGYEGEAEAEGYEGEAEAAGYYGEADAAGYNGEDEWQEVGEDTEEPADDTVTEEEQEPLEEEGGLALLDAKQTVNGSGSLTVYVKGTDFGEVYTLEVSDAPTNTNISLNSTHITLLDQNGDVSEAVLEGNLYYVANGTDEDSGIAVAWLMLDEDTDDPDSETYILTPYDADGNSLNMDQGRLVLEIQETIASGKVWKIQTNTLCSLDETGNYVQEVIEAEKSFDPVTYVLDGYSDGAVVNLEDIITGYDEFFYGSVDGGLNLTSCTQGIVWEGELYPLDENGVRVSDDVEIYAVYDHLYSFDVEINNIVNEHSEDNGDVYLWKGDTFYIDQFHNQGIDEPIFFTSNQTWFGNGGIWPQLGYLREEQINNNGVPFSTYLNYTYEEAVAEQVPFSDGQTRQLTLDGTRKVGENIGDNPEYAALPYGISGPYTFTNNETEVTSSTVRVTGRIGDELLSISAFDADMVYIITEDSEYSTDWLNVGSHASDNGQRAWFYWINDYYRLNNYEDEVEYVKIAQVGDEVRLLTDEVGASGEGVEYDVWDIIGLYTKRNSEVKSYMLDNQEAMEADKVGFSSVAGWPYHVQLRLNTTVQTIINGISYNGKLDVMTGSEATQPYLEYDITYTDENGEVQNRVGAKSVAMDNNQESKQYQFGDGDPEGTFRVNIEDAFDADKVKITVTFRCTGTLTALDGSNSITYTEDDPLVISYTLTSEQLKEAYDTCPNSDGYDVAINLSDVIRADYEEILTLYKIWDDNSNELGARDDVNSVTVALQRSEDGENWEDVLVNSSDENSGRKAFVISGSAEEDSWYLELDSDDIDLTYTDDSGETQEYQFRIASEQAITGVKDGYTYSPTFNADELVLTVTNTLTEYPSEVTVEKQWLDGDGNALSEDLIPDSAIVALFQDGKFYDKHTISEANDWTCTFTDLPQKAGDDTYKYTVAELDQDGTVISEGSFITIGDNVYQVGVSEGTDADYIISNTYETVDIEGSKTWDDNGNQDGVRPESITIYLLAGSVIIDQMTVEPDAEGSWSWSFTDLPKYADGGVEITYRIIEQSNDGYSASYPEGTYDVVNTHTPDQTSVSVIKDWEDNGDQDGERPEEITVYLYADGEPVLEDGENPVSLTLSEENSWSGSFEGLDIYRDSGERIAYTVEEDDSIPSDYVSRIIEVGENSYAFVIVNMHEPETTEITVHKYWDDEDNQYDTRPDEVVITLTGTYENEEGESVECSTQVVTITETDNWTAVFDNLPVYYDGNKITYTVTEVKVDGYAVAIDGYDVTNTLYIPPKSVETNGDGDFRDDGKEVSVGDELTYQIDYYNYEEIEAVVTITDVLDEGLDFVEASDGGTYDEDSRTITWILTNVEAGYEGSVTFAATVNDTALVKSEVDNTASVAVGENSAIDTNTVENPVEPEEPEEPETAKDVDIHGDGSFGDSGLQVQVGDTLTYKIDYENPDKEAATVTITDVLDEGLDYVEASDGGTYDESTRTITWVLEEVEAGYEGSVTFDAIANETALVNGEVVNTAAVQVGNHSEQQTNTVENPLEPEEPEEPETAKDVDIHGDGSFGDSGLQVQVGDTLTYKIDYENPDKEAATVTITDELDEGLDYVEASDGGTYDESTRTITWVLEEVEAGYEGSVTFDAVVNKVSLVKHEVDNTASVQVGNHPLQDTQTVYNPVPEKDVDADEDSNYGDTGEEVYIGESLTYEISYFNGYEVPETVKITDELDTGLSYVSSEPEAAYDADTHTLTWTIPDVEALTGGSVKFTAVVNTSALAQNEVNNTAEVQIGTYSSIRTNMVENPVPDKDVDADGDGNYGDSGMSVSVGDTLTYRVDYHNSFEDPADVVITDVLDEGLDFIEASDGGTYDENTRTITWTIANVEGYTTGNVTFRATVNETALEKNEVENIASVKVGDYPAVDTNTVYNPVPQKDVDIHGDGSFGDSGLKVEVGGTLTYRIDYENPDDEAATVTITDVLDEGLDFVAASDGGSYDESTRTITWILAGVEAHTNGCVTFDAVANETALVNGEVDNTAAVQVGDHPNQITNTVWNPLWEPEKTVETNGDGDFGDNGILVNIGDELTYRVTYKNYHDEEASVVITDALDENVTFVSATDGGLYDAGTHSITWTLENVAAGENGDVQFNVQVKESALTTHEVDNTASVQVGNDSAQDTNTVWNPIPEKSVETNGDNDYNDSGLKVNVGDELTYRIDYTNGHDEAATVTITDPMDANLEFVSATDGGTYDASTHTVTWVIENVDARTAGYVEFTGKVKESALIANEVDNTASVQVGGDAAVNTNTVWNPLWEPEKSVDTDGNGDFADDGVMVNVGDELNYKVTYKNYKDTTASVTIADKLDSNVEFVSATDGGVYDVSTHTVIWTLENVEPGYENDVQFTVKVLSGAVTPGRVENTAVVKVGNDSYMATNTVRNPVPDETVENPNPDNPNPDNPNPGVSNPDSSNPDSSNSGNTSSTGSAKTGDENILYLWMLLMIACGLVIVAGVIRKTSRASR